MKLHVGMLSLYTAKIDTFSFFILCSFLLVITIKLYKGRYLNSKCIAKTSHVAAIGQEEWKIMSK